MSSRWHPFKENEPTQKNSLKTKYEALLALEKGIPHKEVAEGFGIPKNTLWKWKKDKTKIMELNQELMKY